MSTLPIDPETKRIVSMYAEGLSLKAIGDVLGRSHQYPYRRLKAAGVRLRPLRASGPDHSQWKDGPKEGSSGYLRVWISPDDPLAEMRNHHGYVLEHRLVLARSVRRPLLRTETVHHINGNRKDNRVENLQLRQGRHGKGVVMCCAECGSRNVVPVKLEQ